MHVMVKTSCCSQHLSSEFPRPSPTHRKLQGHLSCAETSSLQLIPLSIHFEAPKQSDILHLFAPPYGLGPPAGDPANRTVRTVRPFCVSFVPSTRLTCHSASGSSCCAAACSCGVFLGGVCPGLRSWGSQKLPAGRNPPYKTNIKEPLV